MKHLLAATLIIVACGTAFAELQNVEVGGSIEFYGLWYSGFVEPQGYALHFPTLPIYRPIGGNGFASWLRADGEGNSVHYVEQRTRLHVKGSFTDNVTAFIEVDDNETWGGGDFRSWYVTGQDFRAVTTDDVEVYQSYIEADQMFGQPLRLRIGRQEMMYGSGWLVGTNPSYCIFTGLSFDAVRLTYGGDTYSIDAWWSKLADRSPMEEDGDTDFYGLYGSYKGIENMEIDLYWMFLRDGRAVSDTSLGWRGERWEDLWGLDNYDVTTIHTVGARFAGERSGFDWDVEAAYQWGNAGTLGARFRPAGMPYGDDDAHYGKWAGEAILGYTFADTRFKPRVSLQLEYYGGEDNRAISFAEWLNPFKKAHASVSFNRLFSDYENHTMLDGSMLTNHWKAVLGADLHLTDKLRLMLRANHVAALAAFDWPADLRFGYWHYPMAPGLSFWTREGSKDFGWEYDAYFQYDYTDFITFQVGGTRYYPGEGVHDGAFIDDHGMTLLGGTGNEPVTEFNFTTSIKF